MEYIYDQHGTVISRSRNLAGIRRYVSNHLIDEIRLVRTNQNEGKLSIRFDDGATFETTFASYSVLIDWVRRWRNVYGAALTVQGDPAGAVSYDNRFLRLGI